MTEELICTQIGNDLVVGTLKHQPEAVVVIAEEAQRFVPERTCHVTRETVDLDGERMTDYSCGCFNQPGRGHNFCPNCGAKVVEE